MQLHLRADAGESRAARPSVLLAAGTLLRHMWEFELDQVLEDGLDWVIYVDVIRMEQVARALDADTPEQPGRIGYRQKNRILTINVHYNEVTMVLDRIAAERPGQPVPLCADFARVFTERLELAVERLVAWCDRNKVWLDREAYLKQWSAATEAAKAGDFARPYEFTISAQARAALDACWALVEQEPIESERFESFAAAYLSIRDAAWQEAEYEADPTQEPTHFGQPCKVANFEANLASSRAPDPTFVYSMV